MADCKLGMWSSRSRKNALLETGSWILFRILYRRWKRAKFPEGKGFELKPPKSLGYFALRRSQSGKQGLSRFGSLEPESNPSKVFRVPQPCFVCKIVFNIARVTVYVRAWSETGRGVERIFLM